MKLLVLFFFSIILHPLHVSVTDIKFDEKDKELEITSRIFLDDLEAAIRQDVQQPTLDILQPKTGTADDLIRAYWLKNITVTVDRKKAKVTYLGYELEGDVVLVYSYAPGIKKVNEITIEQKTLTELFDDQSNIVHVTKAETIRSLRLTRQATTDTILFN
ncbi:MAG: hypothetical protein O9302_05050 [Cyclobacteriaceae bacterium]|nr:hypothetical protein [Cytophagales bacterium]MCZ8327403.1 hypothetical protein [Cyclobacteriaceae bacterium]